MRRALEPNSLARGGSGSNRWWFDMPDGVPPSGPSRFGDDFGNIWRDNPDMPAFSPMTGRHAGEIGVRPDLSARARQFWHDHEAGHAALTNFLRFNPLQQARQGWYNLNGIFIGVEEAVVHGRAVYLILSQYAWRSLRALVSHLRQLRVLGNDTSHCAALGQRSSLALASQARSASSGKIRSITMNLIHATCNRCDFGWAGPAFKDFVVRDGRWVQLGFRVGKAVDVADVIRAVPMLCSTCGEVTFLFEDSPKTEFMLRSCPSRIEQVSMENACVACGSTKLSRLEATGFFGHRLNCPLCDCGRIRVNRSIAV